MILMLRKVIRGPVCAAILNIIILDATEIIFIKFSFLIQFVSLLNMLIRYIISSTCIKLSGTASLVAGTIYKSVIFANSSFVWMSVNIENNIPKNRSGNINAKCFFLSLFFIKYITASIIGIG